MTLLDSPAVDASDGALRLLETDGDSGLVLFADRPAREGPVVCAVDASPLARSAVRIASRVAADLQADLALVHAVPAYDDEPEPAGTRRRRRGLELVEVNVRRVTAQNHSIQTVAGDGSKERRLLAYAHRSRARLLVASSERRAIEWLVASRQHTSICPVIVVWSEP